jgi:integrase
MLGTPIIAIQQLMGHSDLKMTLRYAHLTPDVRSEAMEKLERAAPIRPTGDEKTSDSGE